MNIRPARPDDLPHLLALWRQSVTASHTFLTAQDIDALEPVVRDQALVHLEVWVWCAEGDKPAGFMGLDGNKLEALFIAPDWQGQGGGKHLLAHARQRHGPLLVDVNEQNPAAIAFYLANGFSQTGRSATDGQGRPFALLHLTDPS